MNIWSGTVSLRCASPHAWISLSSARRRSSAPMPCRLPAALAPSPAPAAPPCCSRSAVAAASAAALMSEPGLSARPSTLPIAAALMTWGAGTSWPAAWATASTMHLGSRSTGSPWACLVSIPASCSALIVYEW
jgi:hypothetical protein